MVSVVQLRPQTGAAALDPLAEGLAASERALLAEALAFAEPLYAGQALSTGEPAWPHALGIAAGLASIGVDPVARAAGILFAAPKFLDDPEQLARRFGSEVAALALGAEKLYRLRVLTRASSGEQNEILRKMVLGMVEDIRVVLIRLASRTQTLRWFAKNPSEDRKAYARESLDIYSPLANRLGVWQLKWELEDLSFRYLEPELYKKIAQMLDEKRVEREQYIANAIAVLRKGLDEIGLKGEITGRPKHIYSIWNKMRLKQLDFSDVHDVRALRVIVPTAGDCYSVLGVVHDLWEPIPKEFDDYISRPKGNNYQSLHTAVIGPGGRTLEVQIRTEDMHRQAEFGVAAHWRYKESGKAAKTAPARADLAFDNKIAWLRELLAWRDEVADGTGSAGGAGWAEKTKKASLDDTIYVITPQGKVVDLPAGATPVDFAYTLHTDLGHRCRGARVDGQLVKLDYPLASGQRVEIVAAKSGGPSRDWLQPELGFLKSHRARGKVRQWFNARQLAETVAQGRAKVEKEQRREGALQANLEQLAHKLGFAKPDELFAAVARDEVNLRQLQAALRESTGLLSVPEVKIQPGRKAKAKSPQDSGLLIVGVDRLMTQLARCCKPVPPDPVRGFVTRGKGVTVHREDCTSLKRLAERSPERLIEAQWGAQSGRTSAGVYPVDILVTAADRQGLLRDIGEALARERINVTAVRTQSRDELAHMRFSFEVADAGHLKRALAAVKQLKGVIRVGRA
jgi:GTP pyrophosphokinase